MSDTSTRAVLHFTLATAGHVDHGKTSLLRALTGIDPDRLKEEKEREMTTDIGFAHLRFNMNSLSNESKDYVDLFKRCVSDESVRLDDSQTFQDDSELVIGFVDVPGHGKFLKNMLAGVGGIDMALLVVAADESVMPQTVQHVKILSLLGVKKCIVVLTKIDLAQPDDIEYVEEETKELLAQFGIETLACKTVSNTDKTGIEELKQTIIEKVLSSSFSDNRFDMSGKPMPCCLPVDRVFSKPGYGVVVTGTLITGELSVGENIKIAPANVDGRVRGLQTFKHSIEKAFPGQRLAVNIATKESKALERGQCVTSGEAEAQTTFIVVVNDLGGIEARVERKYKKLKPQIIRFYHGTAERPGSLRWINTIEGRDEQIGQVVLKEPVLAHPGQNYVIRYGDYGIAGGVILMTARPRWLNREKVNKIAKHCLDGDISQAVIAYVSESPGNTLTLHELSSLIGIKELNFEIEKLVEAKRVTKIGDLIIANEQFDEISKEVVDLLKKSDSSDGVALETVRVEVVPLMERSVFQHIINHLIDTGVAVKTGDKVLLPSKKLTTDLPPELAEKQDKVMDVLKDSFVIEVKELANQTGVNSKDLETILKALKKQDKATLVSYEFAATKDTVDNAHKVLAQIWNDKKSIAPGDFRKELGTSRKYVMALLSYFDDEKITRRLPEGRVLLKSPQ